MEDNRISEWIAESGHRYPIEDATGDLYATPVQADINCGIPLDPCRCAIAQAFMRATGSPDVLIGKTIAYVVIRRQGKFVALRYKVPNETRYAIETFDSTGQMTTDALVLAAIPEHNAIESKRAKSKRDRKRWAETRHVHRRRPRDTKTRNAVTLAKTIVVRKNT